MTPNVSKEIPTLMRPLARQCHCQTDRQLYSSFFISSSNVPFDKAFSIFKSFKVEYTHRKKIWNEACLCHIYLKYFVTSRNNVK